MPAKRRKTRKPRRARGLGTYPTSAKMEKFSHLANYRECGGAIRGYGEMKAHGEHEGAAHVYHDIIRFCIRPQDRK